MTDGELSAERLISDLADKMVKEDWATKLEALHDIARAAERVWQRAQRDEIMKSRD